VSFIEGMRVTTPWLFLVGLLFIPAVVREFRRAGGRASAPLTGIEYIRGHLQLSSSRRKFYRAAAIAITALLLALLWAGPTLHSDQPLLLSNQLSQQKDLLLAIDVSRSMGGPLELLDKDARFAAYGKAPIDAERGRTRYEAARETVYRFVERFPESRIGLILFSTEPFLARWPTIDTKDRFVEILDENLNDASQLRRFASLTNTDAALQLARDVFAKLETSRGGAVIHISDAEDELENMGFAIRALRSDGIRLYTIGVGISESVVDKLTAEFSADPGFRIFRADSDAEMQEAYTLVSDLEESPQIAQRENAYVTDLRPLLALLLVLISLLLLWLLEIRWHRSEFMQTVVQTAGRER
jgi:hypothetical protein